MLAPVPAHPRRLAYLGTPAMAVPPLQALVAAGFDVALVVSRPDRRRGRRGGLEPSPVKAAALDLGLPVTERVADATEVGADLGVVVAFGRIIQPEVLAALPMVNVHFSLLPRWRGAAPVERALLAGDDRTGVCVMAVEEGLDTGGVFARCEVPIGPRVTAAELRDDLVSQGSALLVDTLQAGLGAPEPQQGEPTYAAKLERDEFHLDWSGDAAVLDRWVRVGGAWTTFRGRRLKVLVAEPVPGSTVATLVFGRDTPAQVDVGEPGALHQDVVACGVGGLRLLHVQPEGKGPMSFSSWRNGAQPAEGEVLGT